MKWMYFTVKDNVYKMYFIVYRIMYGKKAFVNEMEARRVVIINILYLPTIQERPDDYVGCI